MKERTKLFQEVNSNGVGKTEADVLTSIVWLIPQILVYILIWSLIALILYFFIDSLNFVAVIIVFLSIILFGAKLNTSFEREMDRWITWPTPYGIIGQRPDDKTSLQMNPLVAKTRKLIDIIIGIIIAFSLWIFSLF